MVTQTDAAPIELVPTAADVFAALIDLPAIRFERDSSGRVAALVVGATRLRRVP